MYHSFQQHNKLRLESSFFLVILLVLFVDLEQWLPSSMLVVATTSPSSFSTISSSSSPKSTTIPTTTIPKHRLVQVQVIHRHGDRTPITPMKDETFWSNVVVSTDLVQKLGQGTTILREANTINTHVAAGRGPFGKLTALGLWQMVQVGMTLRERYIAPPPTTMSSSCSTSTTAASTSTLHQDHPYSDDDSYCYLWNHQHPFQSTDIRVYSTDFPRTIQSVQGVLSGLLPDQNTENNNEEYNNNNNNNNNNYQNDISQIPIDVRFSSWMIPDPIPRHTKEQEDLEKQLAMTSTVRTRENELRPLAIKVTQILHEYLAEDAHDAAFGVEGEHPGESSIEIQPLAWVQLAEITKCMAVRDLLPASITKEDQTTIATHAAWRWFQTLSHPRVAYLGMHRMVHKQVQYMEQSHTEPSMILWSAHDSTLIGLLCAYRLERPSIWPEYASYLVMELFEEVTDTSKSSPSTASATTTTTTTITSPRKYVRFSLNGEILKSHWEGDEPREMIPLDVLKQNVYTVGAHREKVMTSSSI